MRVPLLAYCVSLGRPPTSWACQGADKHLFTPFLSKPGLGEAQLSYKLGKGFSD